MKDERLLLVFSLLIDNCSLFIFHLPIALAVMDDGVTNALGE
jgi:hypothetical protein